MTEIDQRVEELRIAAERFSTTLKLIEAHNQERLEGELEIERRRIHKIRMLTAQGRFFRAFSQGEQEELICQLTELEMGKCAPQLQKICDMIVDRLEKQRQIDAGYLSAIQESFSKEEYRQYETLFHSDLFLNYIGSTRIRAQ